MLRDCPVHKGFADLSPTMKSYSTYKDSGQPWLGAIPKHWRTVPTFVVLRERQVPNVGLREKTLLSLSYGRIVVKDIDSAFGLLPASFETYQIVEPGNIILRFTDLQNDHKSLRVGLAKNAGIITSAYLCLSVNQSLMPEYAYQQLHAVDTQKLFYSMGGGLRQSMSYDDLRRMPFLVPPADEQAAIVSYLDRKTADIERFITKKRQLIVLLNEQKAAIINRAVTKGLNLDAPMKESGVEWLGAVPAHWEVVRAKYLFREINDRTTEGEAGRHLSMSQKFGLIDQAEVGDRPAATDTQEGFKKCSIGDLVLNKLKSHLGVFAVASMDGLVSPDYAVYQLANNGNVHYFERLFKTKMYIAEFTKAARGIVIGFMRLYTPDFFNISCLCPPAAEQEEIMRFIDAEVHKVSQAIAKIEREIELINEYRITLISDVVTGKIDVREAADAESAATSLTT